MVLLSPAETSRLTTHNQIQCDWCKHHYLACTYKRPSTRLKRKIPPGTGGGTDHLSKSESHPPNPSLSDPSRSNLRSSLGGFYFVGIHLGGISSENGVPFFSAEGEVWIRERTGLASISSCPDSESAVNDQTAASLLCSEIISRLPERSLVEAYVVIFSTSSYGKAFPIIDVTSFGEVIGRAYDTDVGIRSAEVIRARACILLFVSLMMHMEGRLEGFQDVTPHQCVTQVQCMMPYILAEATSESLQVCTMMVS